MHFHCVIELVGIDCSAVTAGRTSGIGLLRFRFGLFEKVKSQRHLGLAD
jgi:hypothetical protein